MRLARIRLRDYRGTVDREITFERTGVTVIEGPNEIGKSSIAEAIDLLLEEFDSTGKHEVKATKPVDRDVGPEVELEFETGPYAVRYRKRFLRDRLTELEILRPRHENLTGREAQERVRRIIGDTVDEALWKALRMSQGFDVRQAALGGARSLAATLDRAAGTVPAGPEEMSLFERVRAEYVRYWTDTGREKTETGALIQAAEARVQELAAIEDLLRRVEADIERSASLQIDIRRLAAAGVEQEARLSDLRARWTRVEQLQAVTAAVAAREEATKLAVDRAQELEVTRQAAIDSLAVANAEREHCEMQVAEAAPELDSARERLTLAGEALAAARTLRDLAEDDARIRRADADYRRDEIAVADLRDRKGRVDDARVALARASAVLVANNVDDATLTAIRTADLRLQMARARLEARRPILRVESLAPVTIELDGQPLALTPGRPEQRSVADRASIVVPGLLAVDVTAGSGDAPAADEFSGAERSLANLCARAGTTDPATAEVAADERRTALAAMSDQDRIIADALGAQGLGALPDLEARLVAAEQTVVGYLATRPADPPLADDAESAREAVDAAECAVGPLRDSVTRAEHEEGAARTRLEEMETNAREAEVLRRIAVDKAGTLERHLAAARVADPDDALHERRASAQAEAEVVALEARAAGAALERETPEQVKTLLDNASEVLAGTAGELRSAQDALLEAETRLRDRGEDGLAERRDRAITLRDAARRELAAHRARAAARKLLYDTMHDARETANRAYVGPLRDRIEALGRVVFGETFRVDVTDDLRIASRTHEGKTIPFGSLSVGTQEQLGVIMRLACAMIVAPDGGVPIILDDALGYSDPGRLEAMGAVLALAGRSCQVIVLTCYPERYRHVGGAAIRRIG